MKHLGTIASFFEIIINDSVNKKNMMQLSVHKVFLINGFIKKTQKTPSEEIRKAKNYRKII